ncbi:threonine synthase [bacterium]|nr:threonine synthase [candidate division CSSED10-310 bacterium]
MNCLICSKCNRKYDLFESVWMCICGGFLDIQLRVSFDPETLKNKPFSLWRYREVLPLHPDAIPVSLGETLTPLLPIDISGQTVHFKQDQLFPTGSFKDRGSAVLITHLNYLKIPSVVEDSSGNAGASIAAYSAKAGIKCEIFVPDSASEAKLLQISRYNAIIRTVNGSRKTVAEAAFKIAEKTYFASHYYNPFFIHGIKTWAYEVCEQRRWSAPDTVILPIGNGSLFLGAFLGFQELKASGVISKIPKFIGVQAKCCAPIYKAIHPFCSVKLNDCQTIAEGIAVSDPPRIQQILSCISETGGDLITVSENCIKKTLQEKWSEGYYVEPATAATIAGVTLYVQQLTNDEQIISSFTGHGLKYSKPLPNSH